MVETHHLERRGLETMNRGNRKAFPCPSAAGHNFSGGFASLLVIAVFSLLVPSCSLFEDAKPEPDTVSPTRSQLIAAVGGFICLYREGANPVDLLYVKSTANEAGLQVVFKIAESAVIPEAIRKGWGDVAVGFTQGEAKNFGLRMVAVPRSKDEFSEDAGSGVYLLRSGDTFLESLLDPDKHLPADAILDDAAPPILTDPDGMPPARFSTDPADLLP